MADKSLIGWTDATWNIITGCSRVSRGCGGPDGGGCYAERVVAGGESGPRARPMDPDWVRSLRDQCAGSQVPFFFKQWGGRCSSAGGCELDGREWQDFPGARP